MLFNIQLKAKMSGKVIRSDGTVEPLVVNERVFIPWHIRLKLWVLLKLNVLLEKALIKLGELS
jgi:hypothetical protein